MNKILVSIGIAVMFTAFANAQTVNFVCPSDWNCFPKTITACPIGWTCIRNSDGTSIKTENLSNSTITTIIQQFQAMIGIIAKSSTPVDSVQPQNQTQLTIIGNQGLMDVGTSVVKSGIITSQGDMNVSGFTPNPLNLSDVQNSSPTIVTIYGSSLSDSSIYGNNTRLYYQNSGSCKLTSNKNDNLIVITNGCTEVPITGKSENGTSFVFTLPKYYPGYVPTTASADSGGNINYSYKFVVVKEKNTGGRIAPYSFVAFSIPVTR